MPFTFVVWSARPIHPLMRVLVRPQGLMPTATADRSPVAKRISGYSVHNVVTTTSPTSPSATGSPVPGRRISTMTPSSAISPPIGSVS